MVDVAPTASSLFLRAQLRGNASEQGWKSVCNAYTALVSHTPETRCVIPPLLQPLFRFLAGTKRENVNVFSNGAGKLLAFHLLSLLPLEEVNIRIATTNDPRHDWCGVNQQHISGVVDVAVVSGGKWLVVGEVKSEVLAAMQAVASKSNQSPYGKYIL